MKDCSVTTTYKYKQDLDTTASQTPFERFKAAVSLALTTPKSALPIHKPLNKSRKK